jgi:hypothetical protein
LNHAKHSSGGGKGLDRFSLGYEGFAAADRGGGAGALGNAQNGSESRDGDAADFMVYMRTFD